MEKVARNLSKLATSDSQTTKLQIGYVLPCSWKQKNKSALGDSSGFCCTALAAYIHHQLIQKVGSYFAYDLRGNIGLATGIQLQFAAEAQLETADVWINTCWVFIWMKTPTITRQD